MFAQAPPILRKLGGASRVAAILKKRHASTVYRWTYEAPRGTGGLIPPEDQQQLMALARLGVIDLAPGDFFPEVKP